MNDFKMTIHASKLRTLGKNLSHDDLLDQCIALYNKYHLPEFERMEQRIEELETANHMLIEAAGYSEQRIEGLERWNAEMVEKAANTEPTLEAYREQQQRIEELERKLDNNRKWIKFQSEVVDECDCDINKLERRIEELESERDEQGRNAVQLFDECKRLQMEKAAHIEAVKAVIKSGMGKNGFHPSILQSFLELLEGKKDKL